MRTVLGTQLWVIKRVISNALKGVHSYRSIKRFLCPQLNQLKLMNEAEFQKLYKNKLITETGSRGGEALGVHY